MAPRGGKNPTLTCSRTSNLSPLRILTVCSWLQCPTPTPPVFPFISAFRSPRVLRTPTKPSLSAWGELHFSWILLFDVLMSNPLASVNWPAPWPAAVAQKCSYHAYQHWYNWYWQQQWQAQVSYDLLSTVIGLDRWACIEGQISSLFEMQEMLTGVLVSIHQIFWVAFFLVSGFL